MKIYYATKTGRGMCCGMYGRGRSVHRLKRGGNTSLLLQANLGGFNMAGTTSGSGVSKMSEMRDMKEKVPMNNIINKLEKINLSDGRKRKNVSFIV